jgi:biopolymer transport protein ExbD
MAGGSSASTKAAVAADINVTPMIDVMLVLLIIFMIVTPAITAGFQATIPRALNPQAAEEQDGEIRLGISQDGQFFIDLMGPNGQYTGPRYISDADLPGRLVAIYQGRTVDKLMYLKAHEEIDFARVQELIEMARKAGVRVVGTITDQKRLPRGAAAEGH